MNVDSSRVPSTSKHAILAAGDRFYEHRGIDPLGLARTLANPVVRGRGRGLDVTAPTGRAQFLPLPGKTYNHQNSTRILLSLKIEQNLSEPDPQALHQPDLPRPARLRLRRRRTSPYGKTLEQLTLPEAAMLAEPSPRPPSASTDRLNPTRAAVRQQPDPAACLNRLHRRRPGHHMRSPSPPRQKASATSPRPAASRHRRPRNYVAEMAARSRVEQFGSRAYELGIRIITTVTRLGIRGARSTTTAATAIAAPRFFPGGDRCPTEQLDEALSDHDDLLAALVLRASQKGARLPPRPRSASPAEPVLRRADALGQGPANPTRAPRAIVRVRNTGKDGWELAQLPEVQAALVASTRTAARCAR